MISKKLLYAIIAILLVTLSVVLNREPRVERSPRVIIGRVEEAVLQDYDVKFKSRIDTGAGISSIHAKIMEIKEPKKAGGAQRVIFEVNDPEGHVQIMNKEIVQWVNIKHKGTSGFDKRPVVEMLICLGGKKIRGRVGLADRSDFIYPLLIGRNFLKAGDFLIDPEQTYMQHPACAVKKHKD